MDVFETAHDHERFNFAHFELAKAQILLGEIEAGLNSLEQVLVVLTDEEPRDLEFIVDVESRIASVYRSLGRASEADEIERRLASVREEFGA